MPAAISSPVNFLLPRTVQGASESIASSEPHRKSGQQKVPCVHCGTPFRPTAHRPDFCCARCQFVHGLISKNGLDQFYELQDGGVQPVKSLVFQKRDFSWLEELARGTEREAVAALRLDLQGLSCIACAWLIEKLCSRKAGALSVQVDPALGRMDLRWQPGVFDVVDFAPELQSFGYLVGPPGQTAKNPQGENSSGGWVCAVRWR